MKLKEFKGCGEPFWYWSPEAEGPAECGKSYEPNGIALCIKCLTKKFKEKYQ